MTDDYVPTTEYVRGRYIQGVRSAGLGHRARETNAAEFDRWLATVTAPRTQPSVEDVARVLYETPTYDESFTPKWPPGYAPEREEYERMARAVLALWPGRTEREVKAEALRAFIAEADASPAVTWNGNGGVKHLAVARADRIEGGEQ